MSKIPLLGSHEYLVPANLPKSRPCKIIEHRTPEERQTSTREPRSRQRARHASSRPGLHGALAAGVYHRLQGGLEPQIQGEILGGERTHTSDQLP